MIEWVLEAAAALDPYAKRMFGGTGIYSHDAMFAIVYEGRVYLKVDDASVSAFEDESMAPFSPNERTTLKTFYEAPPSVLDDVDVLARWSERALAAAKSTRPARARSGRVPKDVAEFVDEQPPRLRSLAHTLIDIVLGIVPDAEVRVAPQSRTVRFFSPAAFCAIALGADDMRLVFRDGVDISDPEGRLSGTGKRARHLLVSGTADIDPSAIAPLVSSAHAISLERRCPSHPAD